MLKASQTVSFLRAKRAISYHTPVMRKPLTLGVVGLLFLLGTSDLLARYKIKEIQVKSAREYAAHQDFQNILIAAYPCETEAKTLELFDTKKLYEKKSCPCWWWLKTTTILRFESLNRTSCW